jgi:hypothetical protein
VLPVDAGSIVTAVAIRTKRRDLSITPLACCTDDGCRPVVDQNIDWTVPLGLRVAEGATVDLGRAVLAASHFRHDLLSAQSETVCALPHRRK